MTPKNIIVPLPDEQDSNMQGKGPIFYTVTEVLKRYPIIGKLGWTERDLETWVEQRVIFGDYTTADPPVLQIDKDSIEMFLTFYKEQLQQRSSAVQRDIDRAEKKKPGK